MKRFLALLLAVLMLAALTACSGEEENPNDGTVINIGTEKLVYTDSATGDSFTYEYLNSTAVVITGFSASNYEPHTVTIPTTIMVTTKKGESGVETTIEMDVTAIGEQAFYASSAIAEINFAPAGQTSQITSIGAYAFAACEAMDNLVLPASVTEIGANAFYGCSGLTNVTMEGVVTIGDCAFYECDALKTVNFPSTLESIGVSSFAECYALEEVALKEGVKSIGKLAFYNSTAISAVTLPASIEEIGLYAFSTQLRAGTQETEEEEKPAEGEEGTEPVEPEGPVVATEVVFTTVEGSYAANYIANPPTAEDVAAEGEENE